MPKPLPGVGTLIGESWRLFISSWNDTFKIAVWILYGGLAYFAFALLIKYVPILSPLMLAVGLAWVIFNLWIIIRLMQVVLELVDGKKPVFGKEANQSALNLILSYWWIAILQAVVIIGGLVLLIIPGIYLAVALMFAQILLVSSGIRGSKALQESRELVKGRWWGVLWRLFAGNFVFSVCIGILSSIILISLGFLLGPEFMQSGKFGQPIDPLVDGTVTLLQSIIQAACVAIFVIYQAKLFRALQRTK